MRSYSSEVIGRFPFIVSWFNCGWLKWAFRFRPWILAGNSQLFPYKILLPPKPYATSVPGAAVRCVALSRNSIIKYRYDHEEKSLKTTKRYRLDSWAHRLNDRPYTSRSHQRLSSVCECGLQKGLEPFSLCAIGSRSTPELLKPSIRQVAGAGLEPATWWLWATRATNCSTPA